MQAVAKRVRFGTCRRCGTANQELGYCDVLSKPPHMETDLFPNEVRNVDGTVYHCRLGCEPKHQYLGQSSGRALYLPCEAFDV